MNLLSLVGGRANLAIGPEAALQLRHVPGVAVDDTVDRDRENDERSLRDDLAVVVDAGAGAGRPVLGDSENARDACRRADERERLDPHLLERDAGIPCGLS